MIFLKKKRRKLGVKEGKERREEGKKGRREEGKKGREGKRRKYIQTNS